MGKAGGTVPAVVQAFIDSDHLRYVGGPGVKHSIYATSARWERAKAGVVNHIPVGPTLASLTAYFTGGNAAGSTHFGNGRELDGYMEWDGWRYPVSRVDQYLPTVGLAAPWAQGVIRPGNPNCPIKVTPAINGMVSGEPNCAFISIENVAWRGSDLVTDPQFNSNVMLRAWTAAYFRHDITPLTQLWHAEIDTYDRCFDPGWPGSLENEMQEAARKLLQGDVTGLRGLERIGGTAPPPTQETEMTEAQVKALIREALEPVEARMERINDAAVLRGKMRRLADDPDYSRVEDAAERLRKAGHTSL